MIHATLRAMQQGREAARIAGKDAESPYNPMHPLFDAWWQSLVVSYDCRDWPAEQVFKTVYPRLKRKH